MRNILIGVCALLLASSHSMATSPKETFKNPCIQVPFASSKSAMRTTEKLPGNLILTNMRHEYQDSFHTAFKIVATRDVLHVLISCEGLPVWKSTLKGRDKQYWDEDSVEVFLAVKNRKKYVHYIVNSSGDIYDEKGTDHKWNGTAVAKVKSDKTKWQVKLAVRAKDLGIKEFSSGMVLFGNVIRNIGCNQDKRVWANLGKNFHQPNYFGQFIITKQQDMIYGNINPQINQQISEKKKKGAIICSISGKLFGPESSPVVSFAVKSQKEFSVNSEPMDIVPSGLKVNQVISRKTPTTFQAEVKSESGKLLWRNSAVRVSLNKPVALMPVSWMVYPGLNGGIRITMNRSNGKERVDLSVLSRKTGKEIFRKAYNISKRGKYVFIAKLPMRDWQPGKYLCRVTLKNSSAQAPEFVEIEKLSSPTSFNKYKWPIVNGKTFFPMGMMMPWPNTRNGKVVPEQTAELVLQDLDKINAAGFNSVVLSCPQWYIKTAIKTLDKAERLGLYFLWNGASIDMKAKYAKRYSRLLAWYDVDEPEGHATMPKNMRKGYLKSQYKSKVKYPSLANHMWISALSEYYGSRDIVATDPYTIGPGRSLGQVVEYVRAMRKSCGDILPCWTILQFHPLGKQLKVPTSTQMRCQTFLALIAGVDGIFYYSTATPEEKGWRLFNDPVGEKTWQSMHKLTKDVSKYSKIYKTSPLKASNACDKCEKAGIFWRLDQNVKGKILTVINSNKDEVSCKLPLRSKKVPAKLAPYSVKIIEL